MQRHTRVRRTMMLLSVVVLVAMMGGIAGAHAATPINKAVTTPRNFFGYEIGTDYKIAPWQTEVLPGQTTPSKGIVDYAYELQRTSNRVHVIEEGKSEMGLPMILTVITSPDNWAQIENLKGILAKLSDPRQVISDDEAKQLASQGKLVYWLSAAIHAPERTSPETLLRLSYHLASNNDRWTQNVLDNEIVILENTINPDGLKMVTDWYYQYFGTPYASSSPPYYNKYISHDDNRDFIQLEMAESQNNVKMRAQWHPTIYHDLHEAQDLLFMTPAIDPTNMAVSPITMAEWNAEAGMNLTQLAAQGYPGAFTWDYADNWFPGYNYGFSYMHNTNGYLYELTGASKGTPTTIRAGTHSTSRLPGGSTWYAPYPYSGGWSPQGDGLWHLMDAVNFEEQAIQNMLGYAAANKDMLLYDYYLNGKINMQRATSAAPYGFVIPQNGGDNADVTDLINTLHTSQWIEVYRLGAPATIDGQPYQTGDFFIPLNQPFGMTAKSLLTTQTWTGAKAPYDITAWTQGLLRDVNVVPVSTKLQDLSLNLTPLQGTLPYAGTLTGGPSTRYVVENDTNNNWAKALPRLWKNPDMSVAQVDTAFTAGGHNFPAGTFVITTQGTQADHDALKTIVGDLGLIAYSIGENITGTHLVAPKTGMYTSNWSNSTTQQEGWTRVQLDRAGWDYTRLFPLDVANGSVADYKVIVIPDMTVSTLVNGTSSSSTPPDYRPGIGDGGVTKLHDFVASGGTLVLMGRTATLPIDKGWGIEVTVPAAAASAMLAAAASAEDDNGDAPEFDGPGAPQNRVSGPAAAAALAAAAPYNCAGSILRWNVNPNTPDGYGYGTTLAGMCVNSRPFFQVTGPNATVVASYPDDGQTLLLSGQLANEDQLHGKAIIVDAKMGTGHIIMLSPDVLYRAYSTGTFGFFWNALIEGSRTSG